MGEAADVVRRGFELVNGNDADALAAICDPSIEFHDVPEVPGSTVYTGRDGIRDWFRSIHEASDDIAFRILQMEEKGNVVLAEATVEMHGRASGAGVDWSFWTVWRVRDGLITYHHGYSQRGDAAADFEKG
jgi:ketosteroid isomerase-like protein